MEQVNHQLGNPPATGEALEPVHHTDPEQISNLFREPAKLSLRGHMTLSNRAKALHEVVQAILSNHKVHFDRV